MFTEQSKKEAFREGDGVLLVIVKELNFLTLLLARDMFRV